MIKGQNSDVEGLNAERRNRKNMGEQYTMPSSVIRLYEKIPDKMKDIYFCAHAYGKCRICQKRKECWKKKGFKSVEEAQQMWREAGRPMIW